MSYIKRCEIKNTYKEEHFDWEILNFFSLIGSGQQIEHESFFSFGDISFTTYLTRLSGCRDWLVYAVKDDNGEVMTSDVEVECFLLGFKKVDGSSDTSLLLTDGKKYSDDEYYMYQFTESDLMKRKHEFTTSNTLTITCTVKCGTSYYSERKPDQSESINLIRLDTLSEKLKNMFTNKDSCDVSLQVKNKIFHAHKAILIARSSVFSDMFDPDKDKQTCNINIPDCDHGTFHKFLQYLYCGKLEDISFQEVLHLYSTSIKFNVKELKCFCVQYMAQFLTVDNVCDILMLAEKNNEVKLVCLAQRFCHKNSSKIVNTSKWKSLLTNNSELVSKLAIELTSKVKM